MKRFIMVAVTLAALAGAVRADGAGDEARFAGGSFDGWDTISLTNAVGLGGVLVTLSSGSDQVFDFRTTPLLAALTLTAEYPKGAITNGGIIRLSVPAGWLCRFDKTATVTLGGAAAAKVGTPAYTEGDRTLAVPVVADFVDGDVVTISGLRLAGLWQVAPDTKNIELDFDGDGVRDLYDAYSLSVRAVYPGGSFDGWDQHSMQTAAELLCRDGTAFIIR